MKDAFEDLDSLKLSPETAERLAKAKPRLEAKAKRQAKLFAMLPIERFQKLAADTKTALWATVLELDRLVLTSHGRLSTVKLSNQRLNRMGISRQAKYRALDLLAKHGLVTVVRKGNECPSVTVHWR
jgi:hypothetical protein